MEAGWIEGLYKDSAFVNLCVLSLNPPPLSSCSSIVGLPFFPTEYHLPSMMAAKGFSLPGIFIDISSLSCLVILLLDWIGLGQFLYLVLSWDVVPIRSKTLRVGSSCFSRTTSSSASHLHLLQSTTPAEMVAFGLSIVSFETILLLLKPASIAGLPFFRSGQFRLTMLTCGGGKGNISSNKASTLVRSKEYTLFCIGLFGTNPPVNGGGF
ncbi:unnamed protein product [Prunus armeniaca]